MNIFKKYFHYRKLGKYRAQLKFYSMILRRKENFADIDKLADSAKKTLLINQANQKLDDAWNQYHIVAAFLVIFWMYPRWVGVAMIIVLLFAFFLLKSDSDLLAY